MTVADIRRGRVLRECDSSGEDVSVNAVIIPRYWGTIPSEGSRKEVREFGHLQFMNTFQYWSSPSVLFKEVILDCQ